MGVYSLVDDTGKICKEGIELSIEILMNQLHAYSGVSEEKLKPNDIKAITEIAKSLVFLNNFLKQEENESHDIMQMTAEEVAKEAEKIMKSRIIK